ncbi:hypothetical protein ABZ372_47455, partial [Streptomyces sp. NPDC005921]
MTSLMAAHLRPWPNLCRPTRDHAFEIRRGGRRPWEDAFGSYDAKIINSSNDDIKLDGLPRTWNRRAADHLSSAQRRRLPLRGGAFVVAAGWTP